MRKKSINEFKESFASSLEEVANGEIIELTKHDKPYVRLVPIQEPGLHFGTLVGQGIKVVASKNTSGLYLKYLSEDRDSK